MQFQLMDSNKEVVIPAIMPVDGDLIDFCRDGNFTRVNFMIPEPGKSICPALKTTPPAPRPPSVPIPGMPPQKANQPPGHSAGQK